MIGLKTILYMIGLKTTPDNLVYDRVKDNT